MHKTVSVTIGGILFNVEENAYKRLEQYLAAIRAHFAQQPKSDEIVSDIEDRIAEEFAEKVKGRKTVITEKDIDELVTNMGTIEDFERFDADDKASAPTLPGGAQRWKSRLYRSSDDQMLGGVCAGIAAWLGTDPAIIRLLFAATIFMGGFGVVLYILLWIILPEARTTTEKIAMAQGKVTLSAIQEKIEQAGVPEKTKSALRTIVAFPFMLVGTILRAVGKVIHFVIPIIGRIIGFGLLIASALGIAGLTFILLALLLNPDSPYIDFPLQDTVGQTNYALFLFSGYFLGFVPVLLVLLAGVSLLTMRSAFRTTSSLTLLALWCAAIVTFGLTTFTTAPLIESAVEKYEAEHLATTNKTFDFKNFRGVIAGGNTHVTIVKGPTYGVKISAAKDEIDTVDATLFDGVLEVRRKPFEHNCFFFCHRPGITVSIIMPALDQLELSGASHGTVSGFGGSPLRLVATGSSHIEAEAQPTALTTILSGASRIQISGSANALDAKLSGSSSFGGFDFTVQDAKVVLSGASRALVDTRKSLTGEARGSSHVYYKTRPAALDVAVSGASTVEPRDPDMPEWY